MTSPRAARRIIPSSARQIARKLCPRLGLNEAETETAAWLVENHLIMSNIAQSRDLADRRTIEDFAKMVQTIERLKMLLVLTVCDIRAVGPGVWNGWKGELLRTLYWETEMVLAGGHSSVDRKRAAWRQSQAELREKLAGVVGPRIRRLCARHYPAYWLKVDLPHKIQHAQLLHASAVEMHSLATEVSTDAFRGVTELTVIAPDHPRLLSIIAGACAASRRQYRGRADFHHHRRAGARHHRVSRAFERDEDEMRRGRPHRPRDRTGLARRNPPQRLVAAKAQAPRNHARRPFRCRRMWSSTTACRICTA